MADEINDLIRIVFLDHLTMTRAGIRLFMENQPGMELVGEAGDLEEALQIIAEQKPDIILFEISEAGHLGLEAIPRLLHVNGQARLILVTHSADPDVYLQAVQLGALGIVPKTQPPEMLFKAIRKVHTGEAWLERSMVASVLTTLTRNPPVMPSDPETECLARLNPRERDIVCLIGQGLDAKQIAQKLYLSVSTVRHYLTSIYEKVGVSNRLELLIFAYHAGLSNPCSVS